MPIDEKFGLIGINPPSYELVQSRRRLLPRLRRRRYALIFAIVLGITILLYWTSTGSSTTASRQISFLQDLAKCHATQERSHWQQSSSLRKNPRWNLKTGQQVPILLKNATLFDGDTTLSNRVDILFSHGLIISINSSSLSSSFPSDTKVQDVSGKFVTPGLVDMHSHHLLIPFPQVAATRDVNEMPLLGPITPFIRAIDGFKPYDPAVKHIASGGVTSSLILPGSGNIIGGEAYMVKNQLYSGEDGEPVVEEMLLDIGLRECERKRHLKMACGENPKGIYGHTRMGLVWLLREHLNKAKDIMGQQDAWCENAISVHISNFMRKSKLSRFVKVEGRRPEAFELDTAIALLRGELNVNIHCYEPQDLERMVEVLHEFGIHPSSFHHALDAWKVPELLKKLERNITIATFAENGFFKHEAYGANLRGPKILEDHGIPVALKSDHTGEGNYAKYLMYQASVSHSFGLSRDNALKSVTSTPARSVQQNHRIGFVRPGYDADLVVWDVHPLQVGATPTQVFVDGRSQFDEKVVSKMLAQSNLAKQGGALVAPEARLSISLEDKQKVCTKINTGSAVILTGIHKTLLDVQVTSPLYAAENATDLVALLEHGRLTCISTYSLCLSSLSFQAQASLATINVTNGYITPGLIAFGNTLGIQAISSEPSTGDGVNRNSHALDVNHDLHYAKYGVSFGGRGFTRARVGGVMKAITSPSGSGFLQGVSVGLRVAENVTVLDGGIWKRELGLHVTVGQNGKGDDTPTISSQIERLRQILAKGQAPGVDTNSIYAQVVNGSLPLIVNAVNEDDIAQLILIKHEFLSTNLVVYGGHGAPLVAKDLAAANISVILTGNRGAPDSWEKRNCLAGPPLSPSPAKILSEAGVLFALAVRGDSKIHGLAQEAGWAGAFAGLEEKEAIKLVSTNFERILRVDKEGGKSGEDERVYGGDFVIWNGNPLKGEGSVIAAVQDDGILGDCWPDSEGSVL